jgi:hypothetical protein
MKGGRKEGRREKEEKELLSIRYCGIKVMFF